MLRRIGPGDLEDCMRLKSAAGWNQTEADWRAYFAYSPEGCFGIEQDGRIVSCTTAAAYPWKLGWIGMVLTDPAYRGRGYATRLLNAAIEWLQDRVETIKLDATELGEPLYAKLGFLPEAPIERWRRQPGPLAIDAPEHKPYNGTLRHPPVPIERIIETRDAWAAGRPGSADWYFGPCYGKSKEAVTAAAGALIASKSTGTVVWDLFPNHPARDIARDLGFVAARRLVRMYRGKFTPTPDDVYAIAGFEWG